MMTRDELERSLLFGVLALEASGLEAASFAEALSAWSGRSDRPLADLLLERRWITPADKSRLEELVEKQLRQLAAGSHRQPSDQITTDEGRPAAFLTPGGQGTVDDRTSQTQVPGPSPSPPRGPRYTRTRLHAKGGIGQVWLAHDEDLGRDIALKELQPDQGGHPVLQARFLREARITAQLEHPNIVPIYELTAPPGGRPYYTMRFVSGRTLAEAVKDYHRKRGGRSGPLELRTLLQAFVGVCQAVAYAHSKSVVHRDLKGHNIILGDFGEVLLLDWGLARPVAAFGPDEAVPAAASGTDHATAHGQMVGTPAFMAPEQVHGRPEEIDARTDVYGLGAVLYQILTGRPPFSGPSTADVTRQVCEQPPAPPRQTIPGTPTALEAVCLKALAKQREERYDSALSLAADVQHWLADEPVSAHREPLTQRLGRWARRHKPLVAGAAALLLTAVVALSVSTALVSREQRQTEEARELAQASFERAEKQRLKAEASAAAEKRQREETQRQKAEVERQRGEADRQRRRAEANFQKARDAVDRMLTHVGDRRLRDLPQLERLRKELLEEALKFNMGFLQEKSDDPAIRRETAHAFSRVAVIRNGLGQREAAVEASRQAIDLMRSLVKQDPKNPAFRRELSATLNDLGILVERKGDFKEAESLYDEALTLLQKVVDEANPDPVLLSELANIHNNHGSLFETSGRTREALTSYRKAEAIRLRLVRAFPKVPRFRQQLGTSHYNYGNLFYVRRLYRDAEDGYRRALLTRRALAKEFPDQPDLQDELAAVLLGLGNVLQYTDRCADAEKCFSEAIPLLEQLAKDFPAFPDYRRQLGICCYNLGNVRYEQRKVKEAGTAYEKALAVQGKLVENFPDRADHLDALMSTRMNHGNVLQDTGNPKEAVREFQKVLDYQKTHKDVDDNLERQRVLAVLHYNLGNAHYVMKDLKEAEKYYRAALPWQERLVKLEPDQRSHLEDLAGTLVGLGNVCQYDGRPKDAEAAFDRVIGIADKLVEKYPKNPQYHRQLGIAWYNRGNLLNHTGRYREARASYEKALPVQEKLAADFPNVGPLSKDVAETYNNLAMLLGDCADAKHRDIKEALRLALKAVERAPQSGAKWNTVGICHCRLGAWKDCRAALEKSMKLRDGGDSNDWYFLAIALHQLGDKDEAKKWFTKAAQWTKEHDADDENLKRYHAEARTVLGLKE